MRIYINSTGLRHLFLIGLFLCFIPMAMNAQDNSGLPQTDTAASEVDTTNYFIGKGLVLGTFQRGAGNILTNSDTNLIRLIPYVSIQQMAKGNLSGVYVGEPNGEPGVDQNIFIQGI